MKYFIEIQLSYQHVYEVETDNELRAREIAIQQSQEDVKAESVKLGVLNATLLCPECKAHLHDAENNPYKFCPYCGEPRPKSEDVIYIPKRYAVSEVTPDELF